eukprot:scaffold91219_cov50-Attheya_sp.AAC.2
MPLKRRQISRPAGLKSRNRKSGRPAAAGIGSFGFATMASATATADVAASKASLTHASRYNIGSNKTVRSHNETKYDVDEEEDDEDDDEDFDEVTLSTLSALASCQDDARKVRPKSDPIMAQRNKKRTTQSNLSSFFTTASRARTPIIHNPIPAPTVPMPHANNNNDEDEIESDHSSVSTDIQEGQKMEHIAPSLLQTPTVEDEAHDSEQQSSSVINDLEESMDPIMKGRRLQNRDMFGMRIPPPPLSAHLSTTAQQDHVVSPHGRTNIAMQLWNRESFGSFGQTTTRAAKLKSTMTRGFQEFCHGNRWEECESVQLTNGPNHHGDHHNSTNASHYHHQPTLRATCLEFDEAGVLLASADNATGTISIHDMDQVFCSRMQQQQQQTNINGIATRTRMIEPVLRFPISSVSRQSIACLRWNPANQDQLAVSFM